MDDLEGHPARLMLAGDLNAKIGSGQGVAECSWKEKINLRLRNSEDKEMRSQGKLLLNWCEARTMLIMNGRTEEDREGKVTCIGHGSGLEGLLDLVMVKMEEEIDKPKWFRGLRIAAQEGSDHLPILY